VTPLFVDGEWVRDPDGNPCFASDGVPTDVQSIGFKAVYGDVFFDVEVPITH